MIAPQELRIGNYFQESSTKEIIQVESISKDTVAFSGYFTKGWQAEPVELTEEWLLKFGFESNIVGYKIDNDRFIFELYFYDAWNLNYVEKQKFGNGSAELSGYWKIHELQNLFFALTGEELTIKEQK